MYNAHIKCLPGLMIMKSVDSSPNDFFTVRCQKRYGVEATLKNIKYIYKPRIENVRKIFSCDYILIKRGG